MRDFENKLKRLEYMQASFRVPKEWGSVGTQRRSIKLQVPLYSLAFNRCLNSRKNLGVGVLHNVQDCDGTESTRGVTLFTMTQRLHQGQGNA